MIVDTFADIADSKVPVRVANIGLEDVWLHSKMRIILDQAGDVKLSDLPFKVNIGDSDCQKKRLVKWQNQDCFCVDDNDLGYARQLSTKSNLCTSGI